METLNRPTASTIPDRHELERLRSRARHLWTSHPQATDHERERLSVELSDIDASIERLSIRARSGLFTADDDTALVGVGARFDQLERTWRQGQ